MKIIMHLYTSLLDTILVVQTRVRYNVDMHI